MHRISHYRVDRLLGVGGMGEVYLAEDATLRRKVALKLLPERFSEDAERVRRFQREARAASKLNHPNIITIYEVGQEGPRHFIATEYIEGQTLRDRLQSTEPLSVGEILDIAIGVASALTSAHEAGILHRDIKPENIMLRPDGYVKVLDFGLAKLMEADPLAPESNTGSVMGTLLYLAPEQARGFPPDARSDIYALGAVMYEMLTGRPPIMTDNFVDLAIAIATKDPEPPSHFIRGLAPEVDRVTLKALQKEPAKRYQTARELLNDLRTLRQEIEFETKLISGRVASPLVFQQTAPLLGPQTTSSAFARLGTRFTPKQVGAIALILLCAALIAYVIGQNALTDRPIDSIAVLPFVNASGDPNSDYLSDGIAESITDSLAQIPRMQVIARSTAFRYKGKNVDPMAVGKELHVRGVVTGQLLTRGNTLILRAALTDVKKGTQVWGEQYDRKLADVLAVQRDLAQEISNGLRMRLSGSEKAMLARRTSASPEAYQAYLRGRYQLNKDTEESLRKALEYFNQAIEAQPDYALAYAGLASTYYELSNIYMSPNEVMPRAREAAERAVQLDASLPEAHSALALVRAWYDWDFAAGEKEFRRAIELNPNNADAHRVYGDFLIVRQQFERGLAEKKRAEQLDPLSVVASWDVGRAYFYEGRYAEAEAQARKTISLDAKFPSVYLLRSQIALAQNRLPDAIALAKQTIAVGGPKPLYVSTLGYIEALAGDRAAAEASIAQLNASPGYTLPLFLARVNAALGNRDQAMGWLDKLYSERSESIVWLRVDPTLQSLRDDPRFVALEKRVGI
ncbi:MAG TPA: protein kinase [Thermoanaerobaculia bacterium]|nr:protein kinase [Thermoanaerobaculia bacterium]